VKTQRSTCISSTTFKHNATNNVTTYNAKDDAKAFGGKDQDKAKTMANNFGLRLEAYLVALLTSMHLNSLKTADTHP